MIRIYTHALQDTNRDTDTHTRTHVVARRAFREFYKRVSDRDYYTHV